MELKKSPSRVLSYVYGTDRGEDRIGFLHEDFALTRRTVMREWVTVTLILCTAIFGILSIFWGAFLHVEQNLKSLKVQVVNFEDPPGLVGTHVVGLAQSLFESSEPQVGWEVLPPEAFDNDPIKVRSAVYNYDAWAAVVIRPDASSSLQHAVEVGDSSYDPTGAAEIIYVQSRDTYAMPFWVIPALSEFAIQATSEVGKAWARSVLQNSSIESANLLAAPQALSPAIGFTTVNLRPQSPTQVTPSITVGALYLIVVSFFSYAFFLPTHTHFVSEVEGHRKLYFYQLVAWKYLSAVWAYFFLSLTYSLVSLAFEIPFGNPPGSPVEVLVNPNAYYHASFIVYWMINWVGMCALGVASENMAMILGQPWAALWLVFWIISNVCTALYPIELAPRFYYDELDYGYAFPLHNIVEATKQILFDQHSRIGLNFGVLFAWWGINTALFPVCAWIFRYKHFRALEKQKQHK